MKKHTMGIVVALLFLMTLFGGIGCDYNETVRMTTQVPRIMRLLIML